MNFVVLWLFTKVFSMKFRSVIFFGGINEQSTKVFSAKIFFPPIHENFLPSKFPTIWYQEQNKNTDM